MERYVGASIVVTFVSTSVSLCVSGCIQFLSRLLSLGKSLALKCVRCDPSTRSGPAKGKDNPWRVLGVKDLFCCFVATVRQYVYVRHRVNV